MLLNVRVTPKSDRNEVGGWRGESLIVRVRAAPEGGRANVAVCKVVAASLNLPASRVRVVRGASARAKVLEIDAEEGDVHAVFGTP